MRGRDITRDYNTKSAHFVWNEEKRVEKTIDCELPKRGWTPFRLLFAPNAPSIAARQTHPTSLTLFFSLHHQLARILCAYTLCVTKSILVEAAFLRGLTAFHWSRRTERQRKISFGGQSPRMFARARTWVLAKALHTHTQLCVFSFSLDSRQILRPFDIKVFYIRLMWCGKYAHINQQVESHHFFIARSLLWPIRARASWTITYSQKS